MSQRDKRVDPLEGGAWNRFRRRNLFDYNPLAVRYWVGLVTAGAAAGLWSTFHMAQMPSAALLGIGLGLLVVALAAAFPVRLPRSSFLVPVADVFVFAILGLYGAPAAAAAAAVEGLVGVWGNSRRLSSRLATPAAGLASMALAGTASQALASWLGQSLGMPSELATVLAMGVIAVPYFAGSSAPLLAMMAAKSGQRLSVAWWFGEYGWLASIYLLSALVAGVMVINAKQFGSLLLLIAAGMIAVAVYLLRLSVRRNEAEHQHQEIRIADAEREAQLSQKRFFAAFTHAAIGMAVVRCSGVISQANHSLATMLYMVPDRVIGRSLWTLIHPDDREVLRHLVTAAIEDHTVPGDVEVRLLRPPAEPVWADVHFSSYTDPQDADPGFICQFIDTTARRDAEAKLHYIAYHDSLTGLSNRSQFNERLSRAVQRSATNPLNSFAVVFVDLDRFKVVNDSLGHAAGNELLKQIAQRLTRVVGRRDVVARLGGDEFAMLLESIESQADAVGIANAALRAIEVPVLIDSTEVQPNASIGITFSDMGYRTVDEMLRDADLAMYQAKVEGRHRIALFDSTMHEQIVDKLNLESEMRKSIAEDQLALVYQPIYRIVDRQLVGFEALMRWTHPTRGAVSPGRFIPLAEESGFIKELTAWALNRAVQQLAEWNRSCPGATDIGIHVNVSGADLTDQDLVGSVAAVLSRHAVDAERLTLEVTETMLMSKLKLSMANVDGLQRLGVGLSVDDFGTGYSSLAYLSSLPFDSLKIDRSFVSNVQQRPRNAEIVRAVLTLGLTLGKSVIAEGVETEEELRVLRDLGVPLAQGYLLSRPLNPEAAMQLLQNRTVNTR